MANLWSGKRVLIVDDEELIALDLSQQFEALGLTVCGTANTARDALIQAEASRPDLISMEINLGAPGEGIAAITLLRMSDLETPVLFITGGPQGDAGGPDPQAWASAICLGVF